MFKTLTDTSKAAIFTALVLILAVAAALAINAFGLASNEFAWGAVWSITPALATVIMLLVVTRDGYSRKGWQSLGLHRLGLADVADRLLRDVGDHRGRDGRRLGHPARIGHRAGRAGSSTPRCRLRHSGAPTGNHLLSRRRDRHPRILAAQAACRWVASARCS